MTLVTGHSLSCPVLTAASGGPCTCGGQVSGLTERMQDAVRSYESLSPVDKALHDADQRRSFVRGQSGRDPGPDVLAEEVRRLRAEWDRWHKAAVDAGVVVCTDGSLRCVLRERLEEAEARAKANFDRMREAMDTSYHLKYPVTPELLEHVANRIDCGGECETVWREYDTNASGCTLEEKDEGCPFAEAAQLRDFAKALRSQAAAQADDKPDDQPA